MWVVAARRSYLHFSLRSWRLHGQWSKFGRVEVSDAKRLRALEEENERLKKLLAGMMMDVATLRGMLEKTIFDQIETESRPSQAGSAVWGKVRVFNPIRVANLHNLSSI